jgi:indolepyruvate ferredoxin oxidoreductase beta subunit
MEERARNIVLVGVGGQGILLASEIVAQAAMQSGFRVKTNETHGMAQRGGSVSAFIRYGKEVFAPVVAEGTGDVLGSFEKIEALRFAQFLKPGGLAVVSTQVLVPVTVSTGGATYPKDADERLTRVFPNLITIDAAEIAIELGNIRTAGVVVLGAMSNVLDLSKEAWQESIIECVPPKFRDLNLRAFAIGREKIAAAKA